MRMRFVLLHMLWIFTILRVAVLTFHQVNDYYTIPFRCLVPEKTENLLVAGRCISGTSEAAASYRVIPCCVATGQAAGTAAGLAVRKKRDWNSWIWQNCKKF